MISKALGHNFWRNFAGKNLLRYGLANNSPFQNNRNNHQTPFGSPNTKSNWKKQQPPTTQTVLNNTAEPQKINPLSQSKPPVETEVNSTKEAPELDFDIFKNWGKMNEKEVVPESVENKVPKEQSTGDYVMSNIGLNRYLTRVYATTGVSLALTLAAAYGGLLIPGLCEVSSDGLAFAFGILSYICFTKANSIKPKIVSYVQNDDKILKTVNGKDRLLIYGLGCVALGLTAAPLFVSINEISLSIIPMTIGITSSIFGGASLLGMILPRSFMLGYGSVLFGGLMGLVGFNFSLLAAAKIWGVSTGVISLSSTESMIGIGLFSAMLIYDTHLAIKRYQKGDADHLGMSIQYLLDLWNLIIRIAREIAKSKMNEKKK